MLLDPVHSVIDFNFYREVPQKSFLRAAGYLVYLGLLFSILSTAVLYIKLNPLVNEAAVWLASSMPSITIADGKATSTAAAPMIVRYPRESRLGILIDTNRVTPVAYDEMAKQDIVICLTQDSLYFLNPEQKQIEQKPLSEMKMVRPITIVGDFYTKFAKYMSRIMYPIMVPIFWFVFVAWKLLTSLFYALVGLLINALASAGLDFSSLYKLAVYAQTPVVLLQAVMLVMGRSLPGYVSIPLGFLVTLAYLWQAIRQFKVPTAA